MCITIGTHLCASINSTIIPNIGTLALVNIFFKMHLAHIVCFNSLVMIIVPFKTHITFDVPVGTLFIAYASFEMCLALTMIYFLVKMDLTLHVPFKTLAMAYIFIKMHMAFHFFLEP